MVTFTIGPGEIVGLLGHNGAGKTTIMKMMTGFLEPTGGTVTIEQRLEMATDRRAIQAMIGYLPEKLPGLSGDDGRRISSIPRCPAWRACRPRLGRCFANPGSDRVDG